MRLYNYLIVFMQTCVNIFKHSFLDLASNFLNLIGTSFPSFLHKMLAVIYEFCLGRKMTYEF